MSVALIALGCYCMLSPQLGWPPFPKPLTDQETWFQDRIDRALALKVERDDPDTGDEWRYIEEMEEWDAENRGKLNKIGQKLAVLYCIDPRTEEYAEPPPPCTPDLISFDIAAAIPFYEDRVAALQQMLKGSLKRSRFVWRRKPYGGHDAP
jgi:hypothetical protein